MIETEEEKIKREKRKEVISIIFLILMILAISGLVAAIVTIHKYSDMLSNPLGTNMERFGISYCSCLDSTGHTIKINSTTT